MKVGQQAFRKAKRLPLWTRVIGRSKLLLGLAEVFPAALGCSFPAGV